MRFLFFFEVWRRFYLPRFSWMRLYVKINFIINIKWVSIYLFKSYLSVYSINIYVLWFFKLKTCNSGVVDTGVQTISRGEKVWFKIWLRTCVLLVGVHMVRQSLNNQSRPATSHKYVLIWQFLCFQVPAASAEGHCVWYGVCTNQSSKNKYCAYNGTAKPIEDAGRVSCLN